MALARRGEPVLERIGAMLQALAEPELRRGLGDRLSRQILRLIRSGIERGVDPYGQPWKPRTDGARPLQGLLNAFTASFTTEGMKVGTSKWYAGVHNKGARIRPVHAPYLQFRLPGGQWVKTRGPVILPKRQIIPSERQGFGPFWGPALRDTADSYFREFIRGSL